MTEGKVSTTAIRYYRRGDHVPQAKYAKQVALLFGPDDGECLLRIWRHDDLADGFADDFNIVAGDQGEQLMEAWSGNQLGYPGRTLDENEVNDGLEFINYLQHKRRALDERRCDDRRTTRSVAHHRPSG